MTPEMMADVDEWIAKSDFGMDELNLQYHQDIGIAKNDSHDQKVLVGQSAYSSRLLDLVCKPW